MEHTSIENLERIIKEGQNELKTANELIIFIRDIREQIKNDKRFKIFDNKVYVKGIKATIKNRDIVKKIIKKDYLFYLKKDIDKVSSELSARSWLLPVSVKNFIYTLDIDGMNEIYGRINRDINHYLQIKQENYGNN
jgi:hypothetical protein